jgi:tetratricopeptide (TPR) repeat protein
MKITDKSYPEKKIRYLPLIIFTAVSLLLYGNSIVNEYCLDDSIVITQNEFTKQGISGISDIFSYESFTGFFGKEKQLVSGGRYRPFSIATFAVEYQLWGLNPHISHFINIILYSLTGYLIFLVLSMLWSQTGKSQWQWGVPFITALLFLFHPVHTEVVTNIKGRDEILALLFSLLVLWQCMLFCKNKHNKHLILAFCCSLPALFSKEHAILLLLIIPFILFIFKKSDRKQLITITSILGVAALFFLLIRHAVLHQTVTASSNELMNNSFLNATSAQKSATILYTLLNYIQLLVFPHPLTYDYYPYHIGLITWDSIIPFIAIILYSGIIFSGIYWIKKQPMYTLAMLLFILPLILVANILFPIGTFMSERFLYIPSLGFCILIGILIWKGMNLSEKARKIITGILAIIAILFAVKTISRNQVWKNDLTLFTTDVKVSGNSAKGNCAAGGILYDTYKNNPDEALKKENITLAIGYLKKAVAIHPFYEDAWILLGNAYTLFPDSVPKSLFCYESILKFNPNYTKAIQNIEYLSNLEKDPHKKIQLLEKLEHYQSSYATLYKLGNTWGKELNDIDKAIFYLEKALEKDSIGIEALKDLGVAYAMKSDFRKSAQALEKVSKLDSTDTKVWINLGLTYRNLNMPEKAQACFNKANTMGR